MRERGVSGTLAWDPAPDSDRGISFNLLQTVGGPASGGADALLARPTLAGIGAEEDEGPRGRRLEARLRYGLGVFDDRWTMTPELGLGLSDTGREYSLGWRLTERVVAGLAFELGLEGTRRESADEAAGPEHGLGAGLGWRLEGGEPWPSRCASRRRGAMSRMTTRRRTTRSGSGRRPAGERRRLRHRPRVAAVGSRDARDHGTGRP